MTMAATGTSAETEVRALLEARAWALRARDIDGIMGLCTPDTRWFDCHSQLQFKGAEACRRHLEVCFPHMDGAMGYEVGELELAVHGDVAFAHYIAACEATAVDGTTHVSRLRVSVGLVHTAEGWRIAHEHASAPFDPVSGQAILAAAP